MHRAAYEWVAQHVPQGHPLVVLDIGGRDINGTVRDLFPAADYTSIDLVPGPGVDIVADAAVWAPDQEYDVVVCCEVFEHTPQWPSICCTAFRAMRPGGIYITTCAGPGRAPHSAFDGCRTRDDEYYANVSCDDLRGVLGVCGFVVVIVDQLGDDTRSFARKATA